MLVALAAALVVGYLIFEAGGTGLQSHRLVGQEEHVRQEIAELQRQHEQLVALREYLRSDEYIEAVARRVLGLVRPGERLAVVSGPEDDGLEIPEDADGAINRPWWEELFGP